MMPTKNTKPTMPIVAPMITSASGFEAVDDESIATRVVVAVVVRLSAFVVLWGTVGVAIAEVGDVAVDFVNPDVVDVVVSEDAVVSGAVEVVVVVVVVVVAAAVVVVVVGAPTGGTATSITS